MPTYSFKCDVCPNAEDTIKRIADRDTPYACPVCSNGSMKRDVVASMAPHTDTGFGKDMYSRALGVPPHQIAEAKQRFPHHNFTPDGRMIITSHQEHKRVLKDLGFTEK